jgi:hypothetical protein
MLQMPIGRAGELCLQIRRHVQFDVRSLADAGMESTRASVYWRVSAESVPT